MKVKCIENKWNNKKVSLTKDKTYDVLNEDKDCYSIMDDENWRCWYLKSYFKTLTEIRNETINKLLA